MNDTPTLTAIMLARNEARHISGCIESLRPLTNRTLVVDSGSTDGTQEIASSLGAEVVFNAFRGFASQRNVALDHARDSDWILFIDPDERLTPALVDEIRTTLATAGDDMAGYSIPRRNIAFGRELRGGGWWPDYQARLIRSGRGRYDPQREVHEVVQFDGETGRLTEPMIHINYDSRLEVLQRQRSYTLQQARAGMIPPPKPVSWVTRPAREFIRRFFRLRGYRDGLDGLFLAAVMALEEFRGCALTRRKARP